MQRLGKVQLLKVIAVLALPLKISVIILLQGL